MDPIILLSKRYRHYQEPEITNRFFNHADYQRILNRHRENRLFTFSTAGYSVEGREISLISCGTGPVKILLWSQMHGDEATASMCFADFFNFIQADDRLNPLRSLILENTTLYFIPMLNPDGAERFTRRNAQGIDINRDYLHTQSPEARILKGLREQIQPDFAFNLHDQTVQWSAGHTCKPATISLLAPAYDEGVNVNPTRLKAMQVIADMHQAIETDIPGHIGLFDDEFESRAFGDNIQKAGSSTILIEAGGYPDDPEKQFIRQIYFKAMMAGLWSIATGNYTNKTLDEYFLIPANRKQHCSILLRNCSLKKGDASYRSDVALQHFDSMHPDSRTAQTEWQLYDLGDLSSLYGYELIDAADHKIDFDSESRLDRPVSIKVHSGGNLILHIENGKKLT